VVFAFRNSRAEATCDASGDGVTVTKKILRWGVSGTAGDEVVLLNLAGGTEDALAPMELSGGKCCWDITFGDEIMIALDCAAAVKVYVNGKYDYSKLKEKRVN
jgi:hypothetical protein